MNDNQTRLFNMGTVVLQGLDDNSSVWTGNATATAKRDQLEADLDAIEAADETQQSTSTGGEADNKEGKKHNLVQEADIISHGVADFAFGNNDLDAYNQFRIPITTIDHLKDVNLVSYCNNLHTYANANVANLGDYDIDAPRLLAFAGLIEGFDSIKGDPIETRAAHRAATLSVAEGCASLKRTLHGLDLFVGTKRLSEPTFYDNYQGWRRQNDVGVRHISIRGLIKNSVNDAPIYKVKVTITNLPVAKVAFTGKTGKYRFLSLDPGSYTITVEATGYVPQTFTNVAVLEGNITDLNVLLVPA